MKPNIVIVATGGTIAGAGDSGTRAGYASGQLGVEQLLEAVPQLSELAEVRGEQLMSLGSQDMDDASWLKLAQCVAALQDAPDVDGIVITHGTDTIEETAYFLNLVIQGSKPVVMTAAMRPATALSADGPLNIFNAVAVAADPASADRGVLVVINDNIHGARGMTKSSTTDVQTFVSPGRGLMGETHYGQNRYFRQPYKRHTRESEFSVAGLDTLPRVDVVFVSAGASPDLLDDAVARGARGLVLAGVGNGNMTTAMLGAVERAVQQGVVVVRSTRVSTGVVGRNIEIDDDTLGTVASGELNPAQARVLLKLVLCKTSDPAQVQHYFDHY
ncbi:L-asparaginase 2 [Halioglobus japonicus]|uniref:Type II asparaginase n=1 Tax=Halioglobus japonicus TaxID=930805 RepID=A0AAP8SPQ8_9GAMM|nr:type II asparaginase [Halioglobus japonicus]AQA19117.1 L-asparaginase 2 [Halioglobus japonicus]PLW87856.1 type II asparaginase [Halioglobus japonicus]GHD06206.1 L-asparaginase 2 [Halioglobus japonicus]